MSTSKHHAVLPQHGYHKVLAINQRQQYQILSSAQLSVCFKLGKIHYCQG